MKHKSIHAKTKKLNWTKFKNIISNQSILHNFSSLPITIYDSFHDQWPGYTNAQNRMLSYKKDREQKERSFITSQLTTCHFDKIWKNPFWPIQILNKVRHLTIFFKNLNTQFHSMKITLQKTNSNLYEKLHFITLLHNKKSNKNLHSANQTKQFLHNRTLHTRPLKAALHYNKSDPKKTHHRKTHYTTPKIHFSQHTTPHNTRQWKTTLHYKKTRLKWMKAKHNPIDNRTRKNNISHHIPL